MSDEHSGVPGQQPVVIAYSTTCFCPQPDDGSDLLDADDRCVFCGTQWQV